MGQTKACSLCVCVQTAAHVALHFLERWQCPDRFCAISNLETISEVKVFVMARGRNHHFRSTRSTCCAAGNFSLVPMPPTRDDACTLLLLRHAHNSGAYFLIAAAFFPTL